MWSGWLAATALWALFTVGFVAEQIECDERWSWASVFILTYIFFGVFILFSLWPCVRYQRAMTPKDSAAAFEDVDDPTKERARIDEDRRRLRSDWAVVAFSLVEGVLLLTAAILLAVELDSQRGGNAPAVGATVGVLIAATLIAALAYAAIGLRRSCARPRSYNEYSLVSGGDNPSAAQPFSSLFACCHTAAEDVDPRRHERAPACFGDFPLDSWATTVYNVALFVSAALLVTSLALSVDFFNTSRPPNEIGAVLWPLWTALGLMIGVSLALIIASFAEGGTSCYDVFMVAFSIVLMAALIWSTAWLQQAATLPPHVIATPLYVALSLAVVVYGLLQCRRCSVSYRVADLHLDHVDPVADGVMFKDAVATSQRLASSVSLANDSQQSLASPQTLSSVIRQHQVRVQYPDE